MQWECHECGFVHASIPAACEQCGAEPEIVRNVWRCAHCGTEGISTAEARCPGCGVDRGAGVETAVDASARIEGEQARKLADGAWRYCAFCDVQVPPVNDQGASIESCPTCGGPLSEATHEVVSEDLSADEAGQYRVEGTRRIGEQAAAPSAPKPKSRRWLLIAIPVALVAIVILYFVLRGPSSMTVADKRWSRSVPVQQLGPVQEEGWAKNLPAGAVNRQCRQAIHHHERVPRGTERVTEKVPDGKRCVAHGYKKKGGVSVRTCKRWERKYRTVTRTRTRYVQVPVRQLKCRYTITKWHDVRVDKRSGTGKQEPSWPAPALKEGERAGKRSAEYTLVLADGDDRKEFRCDTLAQWKQFAVGAPVLVEKSVGGGIKKVQPAK